MPLFNQFRQNSRMGTGMGTYQDAKPGMPGMQPLDAKPGMPGYQPILQNQRMGTGILPQNMNPMMQQHLNAYQPPMQDPRMGTGLIQLPQPQQGMGNEEDMTMGPGGYSPAINRRLFR